VGRRLSDPVPVRQFGLRRGVGNKYGLAVKGDSFANHDPDHLRSYFKALYDFLNGAPSVDFEESRARQRDAPDRCVWVQVETRPDQITEQWCDTMRQLGVNTVELRA
jgi:histone acetyltransferase (RNA polymerase elongator complex component)